ncbi:MAG: hypothetical protein Pg6C_10920 [Treponemataceae bacterium]|nr:MAG: hypothetical protein Pg6C_10920 [Treponemataceae bacterium]
MVYQARRFARFRTVDADIEHDEGVSAFYEKLGFSPNIELSARKRKTISMRADVDWLHLV